MKQIISLSLVAFFAAAAANDASAETRNAIGRHAPGVATPRVTSTPRVTTGRGLATTRGFAAGRGVATTPRVRGETGMRRGPAR
jgi:hypothetical protein